MSDPWIAVIWLAAFAVVGTVVAIGLLARSRTAQARADADTVRRYQELSEQAVASQRRTADELARLTERVAGVEKLLKDVG